MTEIKITGEHKVQGLHQSGSYYLLEGSLYQLCQTSRPNYLVFNNTETGKPFSEPFYVEDPQIITLEELNEGVNCQFKPIEVGQIEIVYRTK